MRNYVFVFKEKENEEIMYIDFSDWVSRASLHFCNNNCYNNIITENYNLDNVTSVLTKEELILLNEYINGGDYFGHNDKIDINLIKPIVEKLLSSENEELHEQIIEEEKEFIKEEHQLTDKDAQGLFDYLYDFGDRLDRYSIVRVFDDAYELGEDYVDNTCRFDNDFIKEFIDYEELGEQIINDGYFYELSDGRVMEIAY